LLEERRSFGPALGIGSEKLFKLIENQNSGARKILLVQAMLPLAQKSAEVECEKCVRWGPLVFPLHEGIEGKYIWNLPATAQVLRKGSPGMPRIKNLEAFFSQSRADGCVQKRRFARSGLSIKEDDSMRVDQSDKFTLFWLTPEEKFSLFGLKWPRSRIRISQARVRGHAWVGLQTAVLPIAPKAPWQNFRPFPNKPRWPYLCNTCSSTRELRFPAIGAIGWRQLSGGFGRAGRSGS